MVHVKIKKKQKKHLEKLKQTYFTRLIITPTWINSAPAANQRRQNQLLLVVGSQSQESCLWI